MWRLIFRSYAKNSTIWIRKSRSELSAKSAAGWKVRKHHDQKTASQICDHQHVLVAVILCVVLGMFCFTRIHAFRAESEIAMRHSVHNTGKALSEEHLPHLFERFYRTDKSRARTDGGYGLGLAIAQTIAKNHRGKITVVSAKNLGTSFTVTFPVSKEKESA